MDFNWKMNFPSEKGLPHTITVSACLFCLSGKKKENGTDLNLHCNLLQKNNLN
jgi:hypothetical protein